MSDLRPRNVYPDHSKEIIMKHLRGSGWKPIGFHIPTGEEYYMGTDYYVHPARIYKKTQPRLIVEQIPETYIGLLRDHEYGD